MTEMGEKRFMTSSADAAETKLRRFSRPVVYKTDVLHSGKQRRLRRLPTAAEISADDDATVGTDDATDAFISGPATSGVAVPGPTVQVPLLIEKKYLLVY